MSETRITELDPWRQITVDKDYITERGPEGDRTRIHLSQPETRRRVAAALLEGLEPENPYCGEHEPVQHRDGKPAWCNACGLTAGYQVPLSSFASKKGYGTHVPETRSPKENDPVVYAVRESEIAAVEVEKFGSQRYAGDVSAGSSEQARRFARGHLQRAAAHDAIARSFEAEQDADPVEEGAKALATVAFGGDPWDALIEENREMFRRQYRAGVRVPENRASSDGVNRSEGGKAAQSGD